MRRMKKCIENLRSYSNELRELPIKVLIKRIDECLFVEAHLPKKEQQHTQAD